MKLKRFVTLFLLFLLAGSFSIASAATIKLGSLNDMTGATSDVGKDYALGIGEAIHYINDTGGINGKKIKLFQFDYGYRIPEALTKYNLYKRLKCIAVLGWGTGDTEALAPTVARDKMPYVSASYSGHLGNPEKTPYNLFFAPDYSTQARGLIQAWYDNVWKKHQDFGKRKPRLAFSYHIAVPFANSSVPAGKDQAKILGFEVGPDQNVTLTAIDTKSQILALKEFNPDVVYHSNTVMSVAATLRDAYQLGLKSDHLIQNWGFDENLLKIAGPAAEGVYGCAPWAFFGQDVKLMDKVVEYAKRYNPGVPLENRTIHTQQAYASALGMAEAMRRADKAGDLTGEGILRKGFETMRNYEIGLGMAPVSFTATDHRPMSLVRVYQVKDSKFNLLTEVDMKKLYSDEWANKWIGW
ncbi:MAG: ABC transporter substrate-binding protein [Desulfobacterales bacterium]|jgi:branched-chain amino acid transport system substrate-binding protein